METMTSRWKELVRPAFGSVKAVYELMIQFLPDTEKKLFFLPPGDSITIDEAIELFRSAGDVEGAKLVQVISACLFIDDNVFSRLPNLILYTNDRGGYAQFEYLTLN